MKKQFPFVAIFTIVAMVLGFFPSSNAKAANPIIPKTAWGFSINQPGLIPVGISNIAIGDPTYDSGLGIINGTESTGYFTFEYSQVLPVEIVNKELTEEGVPAHCPPGYIKGLDSSRPNDCAQLATPGADAYYVYEGEIELSAASLDTCASLGEGWEDNPTTTGASDACRKVKVAAHQECDQGCPTVVFSDSRVVIDHEAYTQHRHWAWSSFLGHYVWVDWANGHCHGSGTCEERTVPAVTHTETYGPINILYGCKSSDPNHCHRPDDGWEGQLGLRELFPGMPDWVFNDITGNKLNDHANPGITLEHLDKIDVNCHTVPATYDYAPKTVIPAEYGCDEANGWETNPGGEGDEACRKLIPSVDATYLYEDEVQATTDQYACPEGTTETSDGMCQYPGGTLPVFIDYSLNLPLPTPKPYVEPAPIGLTLWIMKDYSLGFNISPRNIGPDGGCFVYGIGVIPKSPSEGIKWCDSAGFLGNDAYTLVYSGWVTLPYPGTQQCWGQKLDNGCEGDLKLAALNASTGWHLAYKWFFPGYGGH